MNNQAKLQSAFKAAFKKLSVLGHNINNLIDCSEVIPEPPNVKVKPATFPAGITHADVEQAVRAASFSRRISCNLFFSAVRFFPLPHSGY